MSIHSRICYNSEIALPGAVKNNRGFDDAAFYSVGGVGPRLPVIINVGSPVPTFTTVIDSPNVLGDLDIGTRLYQVNGFEVKVDYDTQVGSNFFSQGARCASLITSDSGARLERLPHGPCGLA
jgi:hypothetical protein